MGFNKRIVNTKKILANKNCLEKIFTPSVDAFIFEDEFSHKICELFYEKKIDLIRETILEYETKSLI
jgi:hypothetical protein